jgi:hypothetical protein
LGCAGWYGQRVNGGGPFVNTQSAIDFVVGFLLLLGLFGFLIANAAH